MILVFVAQKVILRLSSKMSGVLQAFRSRMQVVFTIGSGSGRDHDLVE
jgi:hypothetical protein